MMSYPIPPKKRVLVSGLPKGTGQYTAGIDCDTEIVHWEGGVMVTVRIISPTLMECMEDAAKRPGKLLKNVCIHFVFGHGGADLVSLLFKDVTVRHFSKFMRRCDIVSSEMPISTFTFGKRSGKK